MSFARVTRSSPCPVCRKPDWCTVGQFGVVCMRVQSPKACANGGWFHPFGQVAGPIRRPPPRFPVPTINATALHRQWQAETSPDALQSLAVELGLSLPSLRSVGSVWASQRAAWAFPMRDGYGNIVGIRLRSERGKFCVTGSKQGIFVAETTIQRILYVCEGPTDTAAALDLGLFAVGRPNCCCGGNDIRQWTREHPCQRAVIVSDNDHPGLEGACKVGRELRMPFAVYVPPAKDLREFVRLGGTRAMIENTVRNTVWR